MGIDIVCIDSDAGSFVRHRFARALAASWVVLVTVGTMSLVVAAMVQSADDDVDVTVAVIGTILVIGVFVVPLIGAAAVGVAVINAIHRRGIALLALPVFAGAVILMPFAAFGAVMNLLGIDVDPDGPTNVEPAYQMFAMIAFSVLSVVVAWELLGWARWQLMASNDGFLAMRGWRPRGWQVFSNLRTALGLPTFVSNFGRGRLSLSVLYFLVSLLNVGIAAVFALPFLMMTDTQPQNGAVLIAIGVVLVGLLALNLFGLGERMAGLANRRATSQYQGVRAWDARPPIVFLRTFDQDDERLPALVKHPLLRLPGGVSTARTLDEILLEHASPYGPVIAIGDPRDPVPPLGAARIFVPEAGTGWQQVVSGLVRSSQAVVMCPNDTEGVKWELDLLAKLPDLKVAYLANPELSPETTRRLFARIVPGASGLERPDPAGGQTPIAAFKTAGPDPRWRVLTTAIRPSVQTYTIALNMALQAMLGPDGTPLVRPPKARRARRRRAPAPARGEPAPISHRP